MGFLWDSIFDELLNVDELKILRLINVVLIIPWDSNRLLMWPAQAVIHILKMGYYNGDAVGVYK